MLTMYETYDNFESESKGFNWTENEFNIAIGVKNQQSMEFKHSSKYVQWQLHVWESNGNYDYVP